MATTWLDRLASQASSPGSLTPQPAGRPATRRAPSSNLSPYITSQRPGVSPRVSSLSLVSNDSSRSLLASSRKPASSGLKQSTVADGGADPLDVLEKILSSGSGKGKPASRIGHTISQADLELEFDFGNLSLGDLVASEDLSGPNINTRRSQTAEEYDSQRAKFEDLHKSITASDDVLNSVETNLANFRNDLAIVSADIESLQERSMVLGRRLENRRLVEQALGPVVDALSVPPETISQIVKGDIDEAWTKTLADVDRRDSAHKKRASGAESTKASDDIGPLLDKLIQKAIERIRDFLVAQIKALRSPNINAQIIQQSNFLRFKDLYTFLHKHHSQLGNEIALAYMNTMRWYYLNQFTRYEKALGTVKLHILDKTDTVGQDDSKTASNLTASRGNAFNLGRRIDIMKTKNQSALSAYLAEEDQSTHYLEVPFRNFNLALLDNVTAEYTFMAAFFSPALSLARISKNFNYIFEPTFELGSTLSKSLSGDTNDALGLLICIRLNQQYAFQLQRRRVPAADGYNNSTSMLLWPRLQVVMDRHCESVKNITATIPSKPSKSDAAKLNIAPHPITQRFGQLLHGFLSLCTESGDDEPVVASLHRLRSDVEAFLTKLSQVFSTADSRKKQRFLYNNYSLITTIISDIDGRLAHQQQEHFETLKSHYEDSAT